MRKQLFRQKVRIANSGKVLVNDMYVGHVKFIKDVATYHTSNERKLKIQMEEAQW